MIISYLDQMAKDGGWEKNGSDVDVSLFEFDGFKRNDDGNIKAMLWRAAGEIRIPRAWIPYNDSSDGAKVMISSWQKMYCKDEPLSGKNNGILGGDSLFKDGSTTFGGMAKAAAYLMFSKGFIEWVASINSTHADELINFSLDFDRLCEGHTKKLPTAWTKSLSKALPHPMMLPVVTRLSPNEAIVLGLDVPDTEIADVSGVCLKYSTELTRMMRKPQAGGTLEIITDELHSGSGMGRNILGKTVKMDDNLPSDEFIRLLGPVYAETRSAILEAWSKRISYPVKIAPMPDSSELLFFPTPSAPYASIRKVVDAEIIKMKMFFAKKNESEWSLTDTDEQLTLIPGAMLPIPRKASVMLTAVEKGQKSKRVLVEHFPVLPLQYWQLVEEELRKQHLYSQITNYTRAARAGREKKGLKRDPASVYGLWTDVFTKTLGRQFISALPFWKNFQRYAASFSTDDLIGTGQDRKRKAMNYLALLQSLRRLQHLIGTARSAEVVDKMKFYSELTTIETESIIKYGVIDPMNTETPPKAELYIGDSYQLLQSWQQHKIDEFVRRAWQGAPSEQFGTFVRGALVGMLLQEMDYSLKKEGRSFMPTLGRHPGTLRGEALLKPFTKGTGLLQNINKSNRFNMRMLPFIHSVIKESRTDAFNNGLIMGLAFIPEKTTKETENQN